MSDGAKVFAIFIPTNTKNELDGTACGKQKHPI